MGLQPLFSFSFSPFLFFLFVNKASAFVTVYRIILLNCVNNMHELFEGRNGLVKGSVLVAIIRLKYLSFQPIFSSDRVTHTCIV